FAVRKLHVPARPVSAEQDEPAFLVTLESGPRALAVGADGLRFENALDHVRRAARKAKRREQSQRNRGPVRDAVPGAGLECMRERVAEIEHRAFAAVAGIAETDRGLEGCGAAHALRRRQLPQALTGEQPGL